MKVLGQQLEVPVFDMGTDANPVEIVRQGLALAKEKKNDYVLIDTAGRLHIDEALMDELKQIKELANPNSLELLGLLLPKWTAILVGGLRCQFGQ